MYRLFALFFALLFSYSTFCQNQPETLLWEVSKPGISHTSYLFGTFHEVNGSFFSTLNNSVEKLTKSKKLFVEQKLADSLQTSAELNPLKSWNAAIWNSKMTADQQKAFNAFTHKSEDSSYYKMPPLILRLLLFRLYAQNFCDTADRYSGELMDHYIEKLAAGKQIQVSSLDTHIERAFSPTVNSIPDSTNIDACILLMNKMLNDDASECDYIASYKQFSLNYDFERELTAQNSYLGLLQRNNAWIAILKKAFLQQSCFVAVGFRHLMYKQGLIEQLRNLGYKVTPINTR